MALNAAGAIYVAGRAATYGEAVTIACAALDAGQGLETLRNMLAAYETARSSSGG